MILFTRWELPKKEADESIYWLELLMTTGYLTEKEFDSIFADANELMKIIRSVILTSKTKKM